MRTDSPRARLAVRIGDAERDSCLEALAEHHTQGRLTADELDLRQRAALTAVSDADLAALLEDLPAGKSPLRALAVIGKRWPFDASFLTTGRSIALPSSRSEEHT